MTPDRNDTTLDPLVAAAIERADTARRNAARAFRGDEEYADELGRIAAAAIEHLRGGRLDEAIAQAQLAVEIDEEHGDGEAWRDFAILAEEAAETAR